MYMYMFLEDIRMMDNDVLSNNILKKFDPLVIYAFTIVTNNT